MTLGYGFECVHLQMTRFVTVGFCERRTCLIPIGSEVELKFANVAVRTSFSRFTFLSLWIDTKCSCWAVFTQVHHHLVPLLDLHHI